MPQIKIMDEILEVFGRQLKSEMHLGYPARVTAVDRYTLEQKINARPLGNKVFDDGTSMPLPEIRNISVLLESAGGGALTFPVKVGDLVYLTFATGSLDEFLHGDGQMVTPRDRRTNSISDCVAILGQSTFNNNVNPSARDVVLKYMGSFIFLRENGDVEINTQNNVIVIAKGDVGVTADGSINLTAPTIVLNGETTINGNLTNNGNNTTTGTVTSQTGMMSPTYSGTGGGGGSMTIGAATIGGISYIGHIHIDAEGRSTGTPQ